MHVRTATVDDAEAISRLVCASFDRYIAPGWAEEGCQHFAAENSPDKLAPKIASAAICLVCERDAEVVGVIYLPGPTRVQLFFAAAGQVRTGIGRALWSEVRAQLAARHPEVTTVELNSSPYAVASYKALGFFPISKQFRRRGAVATRMACWLPGDSLEEAP